MRADDETFTRFYREACDALMEATQKVRRTKGKKLSQIDQIAALVMAHLRIAGLLLAERPEIDPAIFDGEMTRHVAMTVKQISEITNYDEWKRKAAMA
jgi:predicted alpha-1,6-mannanase (GH76 family)